MPCTSATCRIALALVVAAAQPAWAGRECDAPPEDWQPASAVRALAEGNGWHIERLKIDDGCYEIKGRDAEGRRLKVKIDPATLKVIRVKREHEGRGREHRSEAAPPLLPDSPRPLTTSDDLHRG